MNGKRGLSKVKRIGILGGMSYKSTIKYYELILQKYYEKYGDYNYPEVIIFSLNFQKVIDYELGNDKRAYIEYLMNGIKSLENAGVDFVIMAANSPHAVYEDLEELAKVPILSIVKATTEKAITDNMKTLLSHLYLPVQGSKNMLKPEKIVAASNRPVLPGYSKWASTILPSKLLISNLLCKRKVFCPARK